MSDNAQAEAAELAAWKAQPARFVAYYDFPKNSDIRLYRSDFRPELAEAAVSTWTGAKLGRIVSAHVYTTGRGRTVSIRVIGTNGATYHGRSGWDNGNSIVLKRAK